jgi:hypothetical protein
MVQNNFLLLAKEEILSRARHLDVKLSSDLTQASPQPIHIRFIGHAAAVLGISFPT